MKKEHKFPYEWNLKDANFTKDKGTVFSCFACGGGSTMGYKLAGFDVLGCNEIDPKMLDAYKTNHQPKYEYLESIETFKTRTDLPEELYNLDILDGSPPCSLFSVANVKREKYWGQEKKFREGQAEQVLDTLFFDFIDLAKELQPKVVVAENVSGLMMGTAKDYVKRIYTAFKDAGYQLRIEPYLLDASAMGVPQRRKRVFFIALRNDLAPNFMEQVDMFQTAPKLDLTFNEKPILFKEVRTGEKIKGSETDIKLSKLHTGFVKNTNANTVHNTITGSTRYLDEYSIRTNEEEMKLIGSYPLDYDFINLKSQYLIGMSVPPVMVAQIADRIFNQWISRL